jgi:predicted protein tyrosine phosphatase
MNVLFLCNQNENRSKTAEETFSELFETKSAGLFNEHPVTRGHVAWADVIFVMEDRQRKEIADRFPEEYLKKRILSLDVPDIYRRNDPTLIAVLNSRMKKFI